MNHKFINYSLYNQLINSTVKLLITTKEAREYIKPYKVVVNAHLFALQHKKKPDKFIYRFYCYDYGLYFSPQEVIYLKSNVIDYQDVINQFILKEKKKPEKVVKPEDRPRYRRIC